jgi:hypothetical protein
MRASVGLDAIMMAVSIDARGPFVAGVPQVLFPTNSDSSRFNESRIYGVTKDGKRFLFAARTSPSSAAPVTVVINWTAAIQK